jgi:hypothetical protein
MLVQSVESHRLKYHQQIHVIIGATLIQEDHHLLIEILPIEIIIIIIITIIIIIILILIVEDKHLNVNRDTCYVLYFVSNKLLIYI